MHGVSVEWTPKQFVDYIDENYFEAKKRKVGRMSIQWGLWSRQMNLILRQLTEVENDTAELPTRYKYCFAYWINRSQLLELHYSKLRYLSKGKIKMLTKQGAQIRYAATDDPQPKRLAAFMDIAKNDLVTKKQSGVEDGRDN